MPLEAPAGPARARWPLGSAPGQGLVRVVGEGQPCALIGHGVSRGGGEGVRSGPQIRQAPHPSLTHSQGPAGPKGDLGSKGEQGLPGPKVSVTGAGSPRRALVPARGLMRWNPCACHSRVRRVSLAASSAPTAEPWPPPRKEPR